MTRLTDTLTALPGRLAAKPAAERLAEYADSRLPAVEQRILAERPVYPALEQVQLEWWLSKTLSLIHI